MDQEAKKILIAKTLAYQAAMKHKIPHAKEYARKLYEHFMSAAGVILEDIEQE